MGTEKEQSKALSTIGRMEHDYGSVTSSYDYKEKNINGLILYGNQNNYPDKLIRLRDESPWHGRLIQSLADFRTGKGITTTRGDIIAAANGLGDTFQEVADLTSLDFKLFGGCAMEVIWNTARTAIAEIYHVKWQNIRAHERDASGRIPFYYIHNNWGRGYNAQAQSDAVQIPAYSPAKRFEEGNQKQLVVLKLNNNPESEYYPLPDYFPGISAIILSKLLVTYRNSFVRNGINISNVFQLVTDKSGKDFQKLVNGLDKDLAGASSAGKPVFLRVDPQNPTFHQVSNPSSKNSAEAFDSFEEMNNDIIFGAAHQVSYKDLFGIQSDLSSLAKEQVVEKVTMFFNTVIRKPQQRLAGFYDKIAPWVFGGSAKFEFMQIDVFEGLATPAGDPVVDEPDNIAAEGTTT